jgi:hypothetical protein
MKSTMTLALASSMLIFGLTASAQDAQVWHPIVRVVDADSGGPSLAGTVVGLAESALTLLVP